MLSEYVKTADWKSVKHVPAIDAPETVQAGKPVQVSVTVGKEIPHPNTTVHHIAWVALHFVPQGAKLSYEIARCEFSAHGQSAEGPDKGPVYTASGVTVSFTTTVPGTLFATAYCNIHGLWSAEKAVAVAG